MAINLIERIRFTFSKKEPYSRLKYILGFTPNNINIYKLAFRHSSYNGNNSKKRCDNNERLEFLGDSILGAVVSDYIFHEFPEMREGELTTLRSRMVQRSTLDQVAKELGLQNLILTRDKKENRKEGHINGNAFEALVGAIYLDKGMEACKKFLLRLIDQKYFDVRHLSQCDLNYKSRFIEWAQRRKVTYHFNYISTNNNHVNSHNFLAEVYVEDILTGRGTGRTKKEAEQCACKLAMNTIKRKSFRLKLMDIKPDKASANNPTFTNT